MRLFLGAVAATVAARGVLLDVPPEVGRHEQRGGPAQRGVGGDLRAQARELRVGLLQDLPVVEEALLGDVRLPEADHQERGPEEAQDARGPPASRARRGPPGRRCRSRGGPPLRGGRAPRGGSPRRRRSRRGARGDAPPPPAPRGAGGRAAPTCAPSWGWAARRGGRARGAAPRTARRRTRAAGRRARRSRGGRRRPARGPPRRRRRRTRRASGGSDRPARTYSRSVGKAGCTRPGVVTGAARPQRIAFVASVGSAPPTAQPSETNPAAPIARTVGSRSGRPRSSFVRTPPPRITSTTCSGADAVGPAGAEEGPRGRRATPRGRAAPGAGTAERAHAGLIARRTPAS